MIDEGLFTEQDYKEFYELENGPLKGFEKTGEIKFGIDIDKKDSGVPFRYPNWQDELFIRLYQDYAAGFKHFVQILIHRVIRHTAHSHSFG